MRPEELALKSAMEYAKHLDYPVRKGGREREFLIDNLLIRIHFYHRDDLVDRPRAIDFEFSFPRLPGAKLSDTLYLLTSLRKSTPPQNRLLNTLISHDKQ